MNKELSRRNFLKLAGALALNPSRVLEASLPQEGYTTGMIVRRGDPTKPIIYLTIDDCSDWRLVDRSRDIARSKGAKITYFPTGFSIRKNRVLYDELVSEGHEVENHTWSHRSLDRLSESGIEYQIREQTEEAQRAINDPSYAQHFVRPPYGNGGYGSGDRELLRVARRHGLKVAMWSSDSNGWRVASRTDQAANNYVLRNVYSNFYRGVIVLQHAIPSDIDVLPAIIDRAKRKGWQMRTMSYGISTL